ncbi:MAG: tRNA-modifying protein YgfZ [Colwellia sp.]|nr:tRNA-modifying protein YgfZ [Colwellia sp.]MCW8864399.1 tRNA-modifying protein YgfZ [Colwellia sp.]MCW9080812.1 tRNA-modifying protein YgfZ [Colwellia sp.]
MPIISDESLPSLEQLPNTYLVSLTHYSAISLVGEEQSSYLQGQVTCDVNSLDEHHLLVGAHCNAKGKVFSAFRLINRNNAHLLIQPNSSITASMAELKKFGVFAKVDISQTSDLSFYALVGEQASELIHTHFDQVPDSLTPVVHSNGTTIIYIAGKLARYLLVDEASKLTAKLDQLALTTYSAPVWDLLEISEGFAQLSEQASAEYVPQMLNLQAINGISFTKGCYLGQETVARMQYLGKNKRALFSLTFKADESISNDEAIEKQLGDNWRKAGDILASYHSDDGCGYVQAILSSDVDDTTQLRLKSQPNIKVSVHPLPYSLVAE